MNKSVGAWKRTKEQLALLLLWAICIVMLIVNNGSILSDGTNEREC